MRRKCNHTCKHWTFDLDGPYCAHRKSFEIAPTFGASPGRMAREGHCRDPDLMLWEKSR